MSRSAFSVVFAGSGGSGAMTAGTLFLRTAARAGYYGLMTQLFGPQVRGGETVALVQISVDPIECQPDRFDLFVALDWENVERFIPEIPLDQDSIVLVDAAAGEMPAGIAKSKARMVSFAAGDAAVLKSAHGKQANIFAAGVVCAVAGLTGNGAQKALAEVLGSKGVVAMAANVAALHTGMEVAVSLGLDFTLVPPPQTSHWLMSGNEAIGLGALRGGVRFVGCYPITPATDLVEWMSPELQKLGGRLVLAEDELAAINMALGASFGGMPAMTVTSGPGFSLMIETIGLGVAAEVPVVVVDVMRGGPSTGIPSKTEQADINLALYGAHGDAPRVVLAPMSVGDCLFTAEWAVYIAESLQCPVIVLSDQAIGQTQAVIDPPIRRPTPMKRRTDGIALGEFKRYAIAPDPITPMPLPGTPGRQWVGEGLTHNEAGLPVSGAGAHVAQINKRAKKMEHFDSGRWWGESWGFGETAIIAFGSSIGAARNAAARLSVEGHPTRVVGLRVLSPIPRKALAGALEGARRIIVLEQNHGAQLYRYLLGQKAITISAESIARPGPLPFRPGEICAYLA